MLIGLVDVTADRVNYFPYSIFRRRSSTKNPLMGYRIPYCLTVNKEICEVISTREKNHMGLLKEYELQTLYCTTMVPYYSYYCFLLLSPPAADKKSSSSFFCVKATTICCSWRGEKTLGRKPKQKRPPPSLFRFGTKHKSITLHDDKSSSRCWSKAC